MFSMSFNSNMVRLKARTVQPFDRVIPFQFQYGAIKSGYEGLGLFYTVLFQFQYGAIKSSDRREGVPDHVWFQFQYGAIKSLM